MANVDGERASVASAAQAWVEEMESSSLAPSTKASYVGKLANLLAYLFKVAPGSLVEGRRNAVPVTEKARPGFWKKLALDATSARPVLDFAALDIAHVLGWFSQFQGREGTTASHSVYGVAKSALKWFYGQHGQRFDHAFEERLKNTLKGAKKARAQLKEKGEVKMEEGKEALSFELYSTIAKHLFESDNKNAPFAHLFLLLSWNLMCRSSTTSIVKVKHLRVEGDAVVVYIARHKSDQEGDRTDP